MKVKRITKNVALLFCVLFACATLVSSVLHLALGYETDTYRHIIDRALLILIGSLELVLVLELDIKNIFINFLVPYAILIILAMLYVTVAGVWEELHPNAYWDVFLNATIAYIVVFIATKIYCKIKPRSKQAK